MVRYSQKFKKRYSTSLLFTQVGLLGDLYHLYLFRLNRPLTRCCEYGFLLCFYVKLRQILICLPTHISKREYWVFSRSFFVSASSVKSQLAHLRLAKLSLLSSVFILGSMISLFSYGAKSVDIYSVQELVVNQSNEVRKEAAARGLKTVFVRLAGSKEVLQAPAVREAIAKASIYLSEFGYQQTNRSITIAGAPKPASLLVMRFAQAPLEKVLKNNRLPIWLSNRPDILVWGAFNRGKKSYMGADSTMARSLKSAASERGLPITNPVLDLSDRSSLSASRLWALDEDSILDASKRYDTNAILAGRFSKSDGQWNGNMLLLHLGKTNYFSASNKSQRAVARSIIDQVTDHLANIYAVAPNGLGNPRSAILQINNVEDFDYYASVIAYLESLPLVDGLNVVRVHEGRLVVKANLNSSIERLINTVKLDKKLRFVETQTPTINSGSFNSTADPLVKSSVDVIHEFVWQE